MPLGLIYTYENQVVKATKNNIGKSKVDMKIGNNIKNTRYYNAMKILNKYEL